MGSRTTRNRNVPYDEAEEAALLGAALVNSQALAMVVNHTTPADFWLPLHQRTRDALVALHDSGTPIDVLTVADDVCRRNGVADAATARMEIGMLMAGCPAPSNAHVYLAKVQTWTRRRKYLELAERLRYMSGLGVSEDDRAELDAVLAQLDAVTTTSEIEHSEWRSIDLAAVLAGESIDPEPEILVREDGACLLYPGKIHSVAGEPECGKSWIMLHAALEQMEAGRHVVYLDFEDDAPSVTERLRCLGADPTMILERFHYKRPGSPLDRADWAVLARELEELRPALIVIDGVTEVLSLHGFDMNSNSDVARFLGLLPRRILTYGGAVALIDHVVKDREARGRYAIGGQHKLAGIHVSYHLDVVRPVVRDGDGLVNVVVQKDRPGHVRRVSVNKLTAEMHTHSEGGLMTMRLAVPSASGRGDEWRPTELMERVSRWLELHPGSTTRDIRESVAGRTAWVGEALQALVTDGHAVMEDGPRRAHFYRIVKPYRTRSEGGS